MRGRDKEGIICDILRRAERRDFNDEVEGGRGIEDGDLEFN